MSDVDWRARFPIGSLPGPKPVKDARNGSRQA